MTKEQIKNIIAHTDHTNLSQTATQLDIAQTCNDAENFGAASIAFHLATLSLLPNIQAISTFVQLSVFPMDTAVETRRLLKRLML